MSQVFFCKIVGVYAIPFGKKLAKINLLYVIFSLFINKNGLNTNIAVADK